MLSFHDAGWVRPRPDAQGMRTDLGIALVLAVSSPIVGLLYMRTGVYGTDAEYAEPWVWVLGIGLASLPLALRRRYPVAVALIVAAGFFVCGQFGVPDVLIIQIAMFLALYTVGAWGRNRPAALYARIGITLAMLAWVVANLIISSADEDLFPGMPRTGLFSAFATFAAIQIITNLLYFGAAIFFGERAWRAARMQALLEAQGRELELERQTGAAQAVTLDRVAIARELHDVVAHHVSVMGIQASAARRMLDRDIAKAAASLEIVETSAHSAIEELRSLVRTLRTPEADDAATTIGIAHLPTLVAESQNAGVPTTLIIVGTPRPLPMLIDVAFYRVVQEALTNVRKHAGRGAEASVRLRFGAAAVEVEISDNGVRRRLGSPAASSGTARPDGPEASTAPSGSGLGLRGMRERVGAVGGEVWAGPREQSGFLVRATVPHAAPSTQTSAPRAAAREAAAPPTRASEPSLQDTIPSEANRA